MNSFPFRFFSRAGLALLVSTLALSGQEAPVAPPPPTTPSAPVAPNPPAAPEASKVEAAPTDAASAGAPAASSETPAAVPAAPEAEKAEEKELRRIDQPTETPSTNRRRRGGGAHEIPFGNHTIGHGIHVRDAVSIFGSTTVEGETGSDAVSVMGNTTIGRDAVVHGAAVAVLGNLNVQGRVHGEAVNVLGQSTINNHINGEAVAVLSDLHLGPNAVIDGDLVVVGGVLTRDPGAVVRGSEVRVPLLGGFGGFGGTAAWVKKCLLWGRPLAFSADLTWAWWIALGFLGFYVILALLFRGGVDKCMQTLQTHPGSSILAALLTVLLTPVLTMLLIFTVVGGVVVPFLGIAVFFATLFGKAVMLAWLGRRITKHFGDGPLGHPAFAVLLGGVIVLGLYTVPVLGFVMYKLLGVLGLGVVVYTLILRSQREKTPPAAPLPPRPSAMAAAPAFVGETAPLQSAGFATIPPAPPGVSAGFGGAATTIPPLAPPPPVPMTTLPRAGFWIRMGALALDVVLVAVILGFVSGLLPWFLRFSHGPGSLLPVLAIYGAVMWKLKGTTIGGIVCGLKVIRVDGREVDWATAIVRALGCFLSLVVAGLGFIWVVIDDEKQSWHDKIAGTTVVRVPKGVTLV